MNKTIKQAERYEAPETRVIEASIRSRIMAQSPNGSNELFTEESEEDF